MLQNGRKASVTRNPRIILKSIPAATIKKIEVITSPGAKYDAEGIGGVINIVTQGARFEGHLTNISAGITTTGGEANLYNTTKIGKFSTEIVASYSYATTPESSNESVREDLLSSSQAYLKGLKKWTRRTTTIVGEDFIDIRHSKYSRQSINFSIQYRFGNFKRSTAKRTQHTISNNNLKADAKE